MDGQPDPWLSVRVPLPLTYPLIEWSPVMTGVTVHFEIFTWTEKFSVPDEVPDVVILGLKDTPP